MPTGYTQKLCQGDQSFAEFVLLCSRAMGAAIMLRDEPLSAHIPEFQPSDYHAKNLTESKAKLQTLLTMSDEERIVYGQAKKSSDLERTEKWLSETESQNKRLSDMLTRVKEWEPPTKDHAELHKFMQEQLMISMRSTDYEKESITRIKALSARDYYDAAVKKAQQNIEYSTKADFEERERTEDRNLWFKQLKASLK